MSKDLRWCVHPDCTGQGRQFLSIHGLKGLEDHWVEKHGAVQTVEVEPKELFGREPYVKG